MFGSGLMGCVGTLGGWMGKFFGARQRDFSQNALIGECMSDGESVNDMTVDAVTFNSTSYVHCVSKNDTDLASYHPSVYELIRLRQILAEMCSIFETQLYRRSPCCCDRFCPQSDDQHVCNSRINLSHWSLKKRKYIQSLISRPPFPVTSELRVPATGSWDNNNNNH